MDPIIAATHTDPYPHYARLRAEGGLVFHQGLKLWVASSAQAVAAVLANRNCHVRPAAEPVPKGIADGMAGKVFGQLMRMNEGERQRCPRSAIEPGLALIDVDEVNARVSARLITPDADGLYNAMFRGPVCVVAALLGFLPAQGRAISELTEDFVACLSPLSDPLQLETAHAAAEKLRGHFVELLDDSGNKSSLLGGIRARFAGDPEMLIANLIGLFSQTYEATAGLIGNAMLALIKNLSLLRDSTPVDDLIAEVQRFDPSVQNTRRFVAAPCEIEGVSLNAGDVVLVLLASANRDPQLNESPDAFILDRPQRRSFTFGAGRHQCPGQLLALGIASATLSEILLHPPALDRLAWKYRPSLNGRIPVFSEYSPSPQ
ncbi:MULTISPECIES: cytochrome P450 [unclassified Pseudomonas]|uniref:cytochrome P450 n=1 Tax=unclassified Pseudomonas TaxID=196821 RepID=UPI000C86A005|nr:MULTISPECIES: cytochrome P450 [unclassified Pseudomonas]PMV88921.1 cytochrome P450 [Pseudomonas sp. GW101-1A09]PMV92528.1 cytochrome P450 [Pseudomonas sp. FW306-2-2C-B10A]PMV96203.1 cytochrome P450 [Pseudomonas sp. GW460-C8]PMW04458.1 cytochrome P450 [Pseudomonas sp. MPR-TSA4]PMW15279.1 cytochrome P450 [Pseudomonas sp. FW306-2-1A-C05A]